MKSNNQRKASSAQKHNSQTEQPVNIDKFELKIVIQNVSGGGDAMSDCNIRDIYEGARIIYNRKQSDDSDKVNDSESNKCDVDRKGSLTKSMNNQRNFSDQNCKIMKRVTKFMQDNLIISGTPATTEKQKKAQLIEAMTIFIDNLCDLRIQI
ncbi:hypothetical protein OXYTRIMIC_403 [Oxytricha trifallax]|uniref:Uncharacterized protein n=1 Tax=Oxytricha trifallax TaxID=1172189 RepID=A0A073IAQ4_9SPIT|nr:hypothetical protein OXYTRIMIC_403 [Oxytricha trifallax]